MTFKVKYDALFITALGLTVDGNDIVKDVAIGWMNSGANSFNELGTGQDGCYEFTVPVIGETFETGLTDVAILITPNEDGVEYGFKFITTPSISYKIWERGISPGFNRLNGGIVADIYNVGDKFVVERDVANGEIKYYKNKRLLHVSTISTSPAMVVDATLNSANAAIDDAKVTFVCALPAASYVKLFKRLNGGYYNATAQTLRFQYYEEYNIPTATNLTYRVLDESGTDVVQGALPKAIFHGDNRISLDLSPYTTIGEHYVLVVENGKREKWFLRFVALD